MSRLNQCIDVSLPFLPLFLPHFTQYNPSLKSQQTTLKPFWIALQLSIYIRLKTVSGYFSPRILGFLFLLLVTTYLHFTMLSHQLAFSAAPIRKVKEVQFGILSPEEIVGVL
jgi:hypothetical protein